MKALLTTNYYSSWQLEDFFPSRSSEKNTTMISQHNLLCFDFSLSFITWVLQDLDLELGAFCLFSSVVHHLLATRRMFLREFVLI